MSALPGKGILDEIIAFPESRLDQWSATLQQFVARPRFNFAGSTCASTYTSISVVMPAYNQAAFIERSILSVLNQDYPNLQFIIMDGGSTDGTVEIIRKYQKYLSWRSEPDQGQSDAMNKALLQANGEIVGWLNSDDLYFPGAFYGVHHAAQRWPRAVLYSGTVATIDRSDRVCRIAKFMRPSVLRLLYEGLVMSSQGVFWRRDLQPSSGPYDISLHHAMDVAFWLKLLAQGKAEFLPQLIGGFRVYEGTKTSATGERGLAEMSTIRKQYGVDDQTRTWQLKRASLRASRLLQWLIVSRPQCDIITPAGRCDAFSHDDSGE